LIYCRTVVAIVAAAAAAAAVAVAAVGGSESVLGGEVRLYVYLCLTAIGQRKEATADVVASTCPLTNSFYSLARYYHFVSAFYFILFKTCFLHKNNGFA